MYEMPEYKKRNYYTAMYQDYFDKYEANNYSTEGYIDRFVKAKFVRHYMSQFDYDKQYDQLIRDENTEYKPLQYKINKQLQRFWKK